MSLSRKTGKFKMIENGVKGTEKTSEEIIAWMTEIQKEVWLEMKHYINIENIIIIKGIYFYLWMLLQKYGS